MYASVKELSLRLKNNGINEIDIQSGYGENISLVGCKKDNNECFIFTKEAESHRHLILLSKCILFNKLFDTIEENFTYIKTEIKCNQIKDELSEIKFTMIDNIQKVLERGEKIEDIVKKSQYLSDSSKDFYIKSKKLNRWCCTIL